MLLSPQGSRLVRALVSRSHVLHYSFTGSSFILLHSEPLLIQTLPFLPSGPSRPRDHCPFPNIHHLYLTALPTLCACVSSPLPLPDGLDSAAPRQPLFSPRLVSQRFPWFLPLLTLCQTCFPPSDWLSIHKPIYLPSKVWPFLTFAPEPVLCLCCSLEPWMCCYCLLPLMKIPGS